MNLPAGSLFPFLQRYRGDETKRSEGRTMTMRKGITASFERCVTAVLSRLDLFALPGRFAGLSCSKAECVCALPSFSYSGSFP